VGWVELATEVLDEGANNEETFQKLQGELSWCLENASFARKADSKAKKKRKQRAPLPYKQYCIKCNKERSESKEPWRRGPDGYVSVCNPCGLSLVRKEQKKKLLISKIARIQSHI